MLQRKGATAEVIATVNGLPDRSRILFVTDDVSPAELREGHLLSILVHAIRLGLPPIEAYASATLRAATYLGLHRRGAIAPGRRADFWTTMSLEAPSPICVYVGGAPVARNGETLAGAVADVDSGSLDQAPAVPGPFGEDDVRLVPEGRGKARVYVRAIELLSQQNSSTGLAEIEVELFDGHPRWTSDEDLCVFGVISRSNPRSRAFALVKGFGLTEGAAASSVAHDTHNLLLVGRDPTSMVAAANEVHRLGGGIVFAVGDRVESALPLPIAGLLSDADLETIVRQAQQVEASLRRVAFDIASRC